MRQGETRKRAKTRVRIPTQFKSGLAALRKLPPDVLSELASALVEVEDIRSYESVAAKIGKRLPDISDEELSEIIRMVFSLYGFRAREELPAADLARGLVAALQKSEDIPLRLSEGEVPPFEEALTRVLGVSELEQSLKTRDLADEFEHTFCSARILTDVRPVFGSDPTVTPLGALIVHNLKLTYHTRDGHKDFFVSLDGDDLDELIRSLGRAKSKASSLTPFLQSLRGS